MKMKIGKKRIEIARSFALNRVDQATYLIEGWGTKTEMSREPWYHMEYYGDIAVGAIIQAQLPISKL